MARKWIKLGAMCLALALSAGAYGGLIGYWQFDEGAGATAADAAGQGGAGTLLGNPLWSTGRIGGALAFGGPGQYVRIANNAAVQLRSATPYTVAVWVAVEDPTSGVILFKGEGCSAWASWFLGVGGGEPDATRYDGMFVFGTRTSNGSGYTSVRAQLVVNTWVHLAATFDGQTLKLYVDGVLKDSIAAQRPYNNTNNFYIGGDPGCGGRNWFRGAVDDLRIYDEALTQAAIQALIASKGMASRPYPADRATDVPKDVELSWAAGAYPGTHDVYIGTVFADVNAASRQDPRGVLVSQAQTDATFKPASALEYGQVYYWRVDEVNANDGFIHTGRVWSFTVEPYSYPVQPKAATASSSYKPFTGPENTINRIGLDPDDGHSTDVKQMWLSDRGQFPMWIQYEFDRPYKLDQLWVWNSNQAIELMIGYGAKDVEIRYSVDGQSWQSLGSFVFEQGPGEAGYLPNTKIWLGGAVAKYVKLMVNSSWGRPDQTSISEVRFFYVPVAAFYPSPADGATNVAVDTVLSWRPGREATSHKIYLGTDQAQVEAGTGTSISLQEHQVALARFNPLHGVNYYWKVDELNGENLWPGDVWSFSTIPYAVVDDFESYDDTCRRIFFAWTDGLGHSGSADCGVPAATGNGTGSTVGNLNAPFAERTVINSGRQSMPFSYDNTKAPYYSEATRRLDPVQDWTANGVDTLTIYLRGEAAAFLQIGPDIIVMNGAGTDIWDTADQFRFVYKKLAGNGSITARVDSVQNTHGWAKAGVMIRETLDSGSKHAFTCLTPSNGVAFQRRRQTGQASFNTNQTGLVAPYWVRITRSGSTFTGECSADGINWDIVGTSAAGSMDTIDMAHGVYIGLAVCSHVAGTACGVKFSNISTTGNISGNWEMAEIGAVQMEGGQPASFYVVVEDSTGVSKLASNPYAWIVATGAWERWNIPLDVFRAAGLRLDRISKITVGIGDRISPKPSPSGRLFIDDIRLYRLAN